MGEGLPEALGQGEGVEKEEAELLKELVREGL